MYYFAVIWSVFSICLNLVDADGSAYYSEESLISISSDESCTACYEIEGLSSGMGSPWLTETGLQVKETSLGKRGPVGVLHPGLDLKSVLKKEPKEAPSKPEPGSGKPVPVDSFNATESSDRKILIVKKKPSPLVSKGAPNKTVEFSDMDLEFFLVKPKPGGRDIFGAPKVKPGVLVKKIDGPSKSRPSPICKKLGPDSDCDAAVGGGERNISQSDFSSYFEYTASSVGLYGSQNSWWRSDGYGTFFEVSDVYNENVFYSGTLCPESDSGDVCGMALAEGFYVFHVYGAEDPNKDAIAWNFCGTHGGAETDLLVYINSDGECSPMSMSTSPTSVPDSHSYFVLKGEIELTGYFSGSFDTSDKQVLMSSLLYESRELMTATSSASFQEWLRSVVIYSSQEVARSDEEVTSRMSFYMALVAEDFGVYDMAEDKKLFLLDVMSAAMTASMESYEFLYNIYNVDQYSSYSVTDNLAGLYSANLISLSIMTSEESHLGVSPSGDSTFSQLLRLNGNGVFASVAIVVGMVCGVALIVIVVSQGNKVFKAPKKVEVMDDLSQPSMSSSNMVGQPANIHETVQLGEEKTIMI